MGDIHKKKKLTGAQKRKMRKSLVAYAFIAPNFIGFTVFTLFPMLFAVILEMIQIRYKNNLERFRAAQDECGDDD